MSLQTYSEEELQALPTIDVANLILEEEKESLHFKKIFEKAATLKGFSEAKKADFITQFYTDLNMDGRFITIGDNLWGLKRWFPANQIDEQISNPSMKTDEEDDDLIDDEVKDLVDDEDDDAEEEEIGFDKDSEEDEAFESVDDEEFPTYKDDED